MAQDAPKRRFLSLIFLVSCISILKLKNPPQKYKGVADTAEKADMQLKLSITGQMH